VDTRSTQAERKLQVTRYRGETRRWNFEKYVKVHVDQHAIMDSLTDYGYQGMDERSKVRHLLNGIEGSQFDGLIQQVIASHDLRTNFSRTVNFFQD